MIPADRLQRKNGHIDYDKNFASVMYKTTPTTQRNLCLQSVWNNAFAADNLINAMLSRCLPVVDAKEALVSNNPYDGVERRPMLAQLAAFTCIKGDRRTTSMQAPLRRSTT